MKPRTSFASSRRARRYVPIRGLALLLVLAVVACPTNVDDPEDTTGDTQVLPRDLVSYRSNVLIEHGAEIFEKVLASYGAIKDKNPTLYYLLYNLADYVAYPFDWDGDTPFYQRMKNVYWAEDNIVRIYGQSRLEDLALPSIRRGTDGRFIGLIIGIASAVIAAVQVGVTAYQDHERNEILSAELAAIQRLEAMVRSQNSEIMHQLADVAEYLQEMERRLSIQLEELGMSLEEFRDEVRWQYRETMDRLDTILQETTAIKGEINAMRSDVAWIQSYLLAQDVASLRSELDAFYVNFGGALDWEDAHGVAQQYASSSKLEELVLNYLTAAKNIQSYAQDESLYSPWTPATDEYAFPYPYYEARCIQLIVAGIPRYIVTPLSFPNPKTQVEVSYGDLDYLLRIMHTRFLINQILYAGDELVQKNAYFARLYQGYLADIKAASIAAIVAMDDRCEVNIASVDTLEDTWTLGVDFYRVDPGTDTATYTQVTDKTQIKEGIQESLVSAVVDYMGSYIGELVSMELDLEALIYADEH